MHGTIPGLTRDRDAVRQLDVNLCRLLELPALRAQRGRRVRVSSPMGTWSCRGKLQGHYDGASGHDGLKVRKGYRECRTIWLRHWMAPASVGSQCLPLFSTCPKWGRNACRGAHEHASVLPTGYIIQSMCRRLYSMHVSATDADRQSGTTGALRRTSQILSHAPGLKYCWSNIMRVSCAPCNVPNSSPETRRLTRCSPRQAARRGKRPAHT